MKLMKTSKDDSYPTRSSLLNRLKDTADQESWHEFNDLYGKLIHGFALKAGLTEDEAKEVVQETMIAAAQNLPKFRYDPKVCSFKTWLLNLSNWRVADQFRKRQAPSAPKQSHKSRYEEGDTRTATIERFADPGSDQLEDIWDSEWKANIMNAALRRVKARVDLKQWQMFDLYALKEWPPKSVAQSLGVAVATVYVVRHRISAALRKETKLLEKQLEQSAMGQPSQTGRDHAPKDASLPH
jgi:RNA polymerase sigma-70 factor (ECF subfamily)